ncbi:hypothetical protein GCM10025868_22450 [Angustibacter aerolatus]|uniref:Beta-xylanase n=1 Tax=Angustibacter aerolatus TaxID=1162965 RepID=A0ABQ6JJK7_9ACTN|nr:endo-1,4-beta-xylanase [Angustibacter aerolatus]GMA86995.1 hypothetical protein GCM10025868_22450 [Angustibacter aerolatus]
MVAVGAVVGAVLAGGAVTSAEGAAKVPDPTTSTLRQAAKHTGVRIGTAVDTSALAADATYRSAVSAQFDSVTPENVMKWEVVEPERGRYDFTQADALVAAAKANHQKVRGHTLVWHNQLPSWLTSRTWTKREPEGGAEAAHPGRGRPLPRAGLGVGRRQRGLRRGRVAARLLWLQVIGPEYIEDAFRWAHQADPKALLFYNDYNLESIGPKSDAAYALVKKAPREGRAGAGRGLPGAPQHPVPLPRGPRREPAALRAARGEDGHDRGRRAHHAARRPGRGERAERRLHPAAAGLPARARLRLVHRLGIHRQVPVGAADVPR